MYSLLLSVIRVPFVTYRNQVLATTKRHTKTPDSLPSLAMQHSAAQVCGQKRKKEMLFSCLCTSGLNLAT